MVSHRETWVVWRKAAGGVGKRNSGHSERYKSRIWWRMTILWDLTGADGVREKMGLRCHGHRTWEED